MLGGPSPTCLQTNPSYCRIIPNLYALCYLIQAMLWRLLVSIMENKELDLASIK